MIDNPAEWLNAGVHLRQYDNVVIQWLGKQFPQQGRIHLDSSFSLLGCFLTRPNLLDKGGRSESEVSEDSLWLLTLSLSWVFFFFFFARSELTSDGRHFLGFSGSASDAVFLLELLSMKLSEDCETFKFVFLEEVLATSFFHSFLFFHWFYTDIWVIAEIS